MFSRDQHQAWTAFGNLVCKMLPEIYIMLVTFFDYRLISLIYSSSIVLWKICKAAESAEQQRQAMQKMSGHRCSWLCYSPCNIYVLQAGSRQDTLLRITSSRCQEINQKCCHIFWILPECVRVCYMLSTRCFACWEFVGVSLQPAWLWAPKTEKYCNCDCSILQLTADTRFALLLLQLQ